MKPINFPNTKLDISTLELVAQGRERLVYQSDVYPDLLFKVQKAASERELKPKDLKSTLLRRYPSFKNYIVLRENKEFVNLCLNGSLSIDDLPISRLFGFVASDKGPVQIVEKVSDDGKTIGPTLRQLFEAGAVGTPEMALLGKLAQNLLASKIALNDVNESNVVLGRDGAGQQRFVLVDGIGDIHVLPVRTYFQKARTSHLVKAFKRLGGEAWVFDPEAFTYTAT